MLGFEQFLQTFGDITLSKIITIILAIVFLWGIYKQIKKFFENKKKVLIEKHESEKLKDEQLQKVLEEVNKYPQYREQSRKIQKEFRNEIDELKDSQNVLSETQQEICKTLVDMKTTMDKRERNRIRDRLLQIYRHYTNEKTNPNHTIPRMEYEVFCELFDDYEEAGGNGYMHSVVQTEMNKLEIID